MPVPRLRHALQNFHQCLRILCSWLVCAIFGLTFMALWPFLGATKTWLMLRLPWAKVILSVLRIRLEVHGAEHLRGPGIFIANHASLIDVVILPALVPRECRLVAKRAVLWFPIVGWAFGAGGALLIDRHKPRQAAVKLAQGLRKLPEGWSLLIFPEGTRSRTGDLQRFKRGAFTLAVASRLPIVPIGLTGTQNIIGTGSWFVRPGLVRVQVGQPIDTTGWSNHTLREHISVGHDAVNQCLVDLGRSVAGQQVADPHGRRLSSPP